MSLTDDRVPLINPDTGETMRADPGQLRTLKMPEGYVLAEDLSVDDWFAIVERLSGRTADD